jgi:hypothetical protein
MNEKFKGFVRNYFYTLVAFGVAVAYIFVGFVTIDSTGKTVWQIFADGIVIMILGIIIDMLFGAQGIQSGRQTDAVQQSEKWHEEIIRKVRPYSDRMRDFCERKNAEALATARQQILMEYGYRYPDYFEEDGTLKQFPEIDGEDKKDRKRRYRAYKKARDFKVTMLTVSLLTSDGNTTKDPNAMGRSVSRFMASQTRKDVSSKIFFSMFWGLYGIKILQDISWENLIGTTLQVAMLLGIGTMKFITSKMYITGEYRDRIETKNRLLEEFALSLETEGKEDGTEQRE